MECTSGRGMRKLQMGKDGWGEVGGYMNAKISKLEDQFQKERAKADKDDAIESSIFRGVSVHVNGYTKPTADEIKTLMSQHGGTYVYYYSRSRVTHTIANNLPFSKIKALKPGQLVVRPEWITDSINAGKLLPTLAYEQYGNHRGQTNINFSTSSEIKATPAADRSHHVELDETLKSSSSDVQYGSAGIRSIDYSDLSRRKDETNERRRRSITDENFESETRSEGRDSEGRDSEGKNNGGNGNGGNSNGGNNNGEGNVLDDGSSKSDERFSAFRPLFPNARLTPVKRELVTLSPRGSRASIISRADQRVNRNDGLAAGIESPTSDYSNLNMTPSLAARGGPDFDTGTPRVFRPGNASTPSVARSTQSPITDSQVQAWLDEPEGSTPTQGSSQKGDEIPRKISQESRHQSSTSVSRKCSTVSSRNSRHSMDLFDSSVDGDEDNLLSLSADDRQSSSSRGSRKRAKRRLDLIEEVEMPKARKDSNDGMPELDSRPGSSDFNLRLSDSGSEVSIPLLQLEPTTRGGKTLVGQSSDFLKDCNIERVSGMNGEPFQKEPDSERNGSEWKTNGYGDSRLGVGSDSKTDVIGGNSDLNNESESRTKKSPPGRAIRAGDANFVAEFYNNSRLHHLSTWGAECRDYVTLLQSEGDTSFPGRRRLVENLKRSKTTPDEVDQSQNSSGSGIVQSGETSGSLSQSERVVMHIDMDCFFVAVGLRNRPELKGKPVAVTHSKGGAEPKRTGGQNSEVEREMWMKKKLGRSKLKIAPPQTTAAESGTTSENVARRNDASSMADIASCSYEARQAGVKNGMVVGRALQMCPDLVTIPYDFEGYNQVSRVLYDSVASYTHHLEAVSCDELFVDCNDVLKSVKCTASQFADFLRSEIEEKTGCTASAGIGPNILLARLATRVAKPNGSYHLTSDKVDDFMEKQNVKDLPGVGWSTLHRLEALGVVSCSDLQQMSLESLRREFGQKTGSLLCRYSRGQDDREVKSEKIRKSVSAEINYGIRFSKNEEAHEFIRELAQEVETRLKKARMLGKALTLKMKIRSEGAPKETSKFGGHGVCDNVSKSTAVSKATDDRDVIARECLQLYKALKIDPSDLRGLGIQLSKLVAAEEKLDKRQNILKFQAAPKQTESESSFTSPRQAVTSLAQKGMTSLAQKGVTSLAQKGVTSLAQKEMTSLAQKGMTSQAQKGMTSLAQKGMTSQAQKGMTSRAQKGMTSLAQKGMTSQAQKAMASGELRKEALDEFLVSPSQVDPDVLDELPIHLQRQIRAAMKRAGRSDVIEVDGEPEAGPSTTLDDSVRPGCSHWSSGNDVIMADDNEAETVAVARDEEFVDVEDNELPSFSQVDQDCFEALPMSIREEILGAYAARNKSRQATPTKRPPSGGQTTPTKVMALSWKPGADRSPGKSPRKKSPRKSPKKSPAKFKQPTRRATKKRKSPKKTEVPKPRSAASVTSSPEIDEPEKPVSLCDAVSLKDVKSLVEEWMTSCTCPQDADVQRFHAYMEELVLGRNLEQALLLIRFIQRKMMKLPHRHQWQDAANDVIDRVQACVVQEYGAPLKLVT